MAGAAGDESLATAFGHGLVPPYRSEIVEVGEFADVMDFHLSGLLAKLAPARRSRVISSRRG